MVVAENDGGVVVLAIAAEVSVSLTAAGLGGAAAGEATLLCLQAPVACGEFVGGFVGPEEPSPSPAMAVGGWFRKACDFAASFTKR